MNPFQAHSAAVANVQKIFGDGVLRTSGAVLRIFQTDVPCTHSEVMDDFDFGAGKIPKLFIDQVEFIAADIGMAKPRKGVTCQLTVRSGTEPLKLQLWMGGLLPGGLLYRFKAVDENFNA